MNKTVCNKFKTKTIIVDMDDTITWLLPVWVHYLNQKHNLNVDWHNIKEWNMAIAFPSLTHEQIYEPLMTEEIWDKVIPREGAVETLTQLNKSGTYEIFICTTTDYRNVKKKKKKVISKYFPFIDWNHVIIAHHKQMIYADFIIDDAPQNLVGGCQKHNLLMTMPHNENFNIEENKIERVNNWKDVSFLINNK